VPVRSAPLFAATATFTVPLPVPLAPLLMVSHDALLVAFHAQVLPVVTLTLVASPAAGELRVIGVIAKVQGAAPACVTEKVCPAIVTVPVRCEVLVFAATLTATMRLPVPVEPDVTLSHDALLVVLQVQRLVVVTVTFVVSPAAGDVLLTGLIEYAQAGVPGCVTVNACPAIVTDPVRWVVPVFAATVTLADPEPVAAPLTPSHDALLDEVHAHDPPVLTATLVVSPPAGDVRVAGLMLNEHAGAPACVTVNVRPAIVIVPVRCEVLAFAATTTLTLPLPVPVMPELTVSHEALLVVLHVHRLVVVTATTVVSPPAGELRLTGEIVYEQAVAAACVTVKVWPAIVMVPVRVDVAVFCATEYDTVPAPLPDAPAVTVIQAALLAAVHAQPADALTPTVPLPAPDPYEALAAERLGVHGALNEN
jgi:hypothetical protein